MIPILIAHPIRFPVHSLPMWGVVLAMLTGCGGDDKPADSNGLSGSPPAAPARVTGPSSGLKAQKALEDGWGAMFWRNATAWKVGGGDVVLGPRDAATVRTSGDPLVCGGVAAKGAPKGGALVLPAGAKLTEMKKSPAIQAHRVERAAWRLDEVLPAKSKYAAKVPSTSPSQQRGINVGSVAKTRRYGSPPFLLATGVRDCAAAVVFTDLNAEKILAYDQLSGTCNPPRVIAAADYDGDGNREFAVFTEDLVVAYRILDSPGQFTMTRIGEWSCKTTE